MSNTPFAKRRSGGRRDAFGSGGPRRRILGRRAARHARRSGRRDFPRTTTTQSGVHVGLGVRRELANGSIGARAEIEDVDGDLLLAVRALDYRRHLTERFAVTAFLARRASTSRRRRMAIISAPACN